jgi:hypothetical protein
MFWDISDKFQPSLVRTPETLEGCAVVVKYTEMVVQWGFKILMVGPLGMWDLVPETVCFGNRQLDGRLRLARTNDFRTSLLLHYCLTLLHLIVLQCRS